MSLLKNIMSNGIGKKCGYRCRLPRELAIPAVMTFYSSLSRIFIISAAVITCGSLGKCLRLPVTKKESSLLRQTS